MRGRAVSVRAGMVVVGWALLAQACAPKVPPTGQSNGFTVRLESLLPAAGTVVSQSAVLEAELSYTVPGSDKGTFYLGPMLETVGSSESEDLPSTTSIGDGVTRLKSAAGTHQVKVSFETAWLNPQIKRPFRVWFYILKKTKANKLRVVARLGPFTFPTE